MKKLFMGLIILLACATPSIAMAGIPIVLNTGDELFDIDGAPTFDEGFKVGYACQRLGIFGADIWTWDCKMMAVNTKTNYVADLPSEIMPELQQKYTESDRSRNPWNHYGAIGMLLVLIGVSVWDKIKKPKDTDTETEPAAAE